MSRSAQEFFRRPIPLVLLKYSAGDSLAGATLTRASAGTYTEQASDALLDYEPGDSLAGATVTRASTASYTEQV